MKISKTNIRLVDVACTVLNKPVYTGLAYVIKNGNINMWAKYKPVRHHFTYDRPSDWWKGKMGDCGIDYDIYDNPQALINAMESGPAYRYLTYRRI